MIRARLVSLIPVFARQRIKAGLAAIKRAVIRCCAGNGFFASLYYSFFNHKFYREHKAVLQAQLEFARRVQKPLNSSARLRRNIHRLEKGLIMQPRRPVFAEAYIGETLTAYQAAVASKALCPQELGWATDVLHQYFTVVSDNTVIAAARAQFNALSSGAVSGSAVPYAHHTLPDNPVSYSQLFTLFQRRRSVRWYQQKPVDSALVHEAVAAAALAPTACNRQPYQFYLINNPEKAADIAKCAMGTVGFADNIPCLIVVVGDLSAYEAERDRHVIYIDAALASMQLMLALESLGLQSCPINWPDEEPREREMAEKLQLQYWQRPVMLLATGYARPDGGVPFSQKKPPQQLIKEIN